MLTGFQFRRNPNAAREADVMPGRRRKVRSGIGNYGQENGTVQRTEFRRGNLPRRLGAAQLAKTEIKLARSPHSPFRI